MGPIAMSTDPVDYQDAHGIFSSDFDECPIVSYELVDGYEHLIGTTFVSLNEEQDTNGVTQPTLAITAYESFDVLFYIRAQTTGGATVQLQVSAKTCGKYTDEIIST